MHHFRYLGHASGGLERSSQKISQGFKGPGEDVFAFAGSLLESERIYPTPTCLDSLLVARYLKHPQLNTATGGSR